MPNLRFSSLAFACAVTALCSAAAFPASEGDLDVSFAGTGIATMSFDIGTYRSDLGTAVIPLPDGSLRLVGSITLGAMAEPRALAVGGITATGALDTTFGGGDGRVDYTWGSSVWDLVAAAVLPTGEIVLAGSVKWSLTDYDFLIVQLLADGSLDPRFGGGDGYVTVPFDVNPGGDLFDLASSLDVTSSGDILVAGSVKRAGSDWDMAVVRLTPTGALDPDFGDGTGKIVVAIDAGGYAGQDQALAIFPSGAGQIVLVGSCENGAASDRDFALVMLDQGGHLSPSFGSGGKLVLPFNLVASGLDDANGGTADGLGRLFAVGRAENAAGHTEAAVACVTLTGAPCSGFGSAGKVHFPLAASPQGYEQLTGAAVDDLGRLVASGSAYGANRDVAVVRLLPNGNLDTTFAGTGKRVVDLNHGPGGDDDEALGLALSDGRPVVVGATEYNGADDDFFVLRVWVALLFADGFEGGTFEGWSSSSP